MFDEGVPANLVSTSKTLKNASFTMQAGKDTATFESGQIKKSTIDTGAGGDDVIIGKNASVKGSNFNLGGGKDKIEIGGQIIKAGINMGDDNKKDKIIIDSLDNIEKILTIDNFGKKDKIIIDGEKYGYKDLQKLGGSIGNIEINFQGEDDSSSTSTNPTIAQGFDFL